MIDDNFHSRIELSGRIKTLFYQLQKEPVNRHLVGELSKEIIGIIDCFTHSEYKKWDYYKKLCRDLPSYSFTPNISKLEDLKELIKKPVQLKTIQSFESLFRDSAKAQKVKAILEIKGYTVKGEWKGLSRNKSELLAAYHVLKPILYDGKVTPQATVFYNEFGKSVGNGNIKNGEYITDKMLRNYPPLDDIAEFEKVFASILP